MAAGLKELIFLSYGVFAESRRIELETKICTRLGNSEKDPNTVEFGAIGFSDPCCG